MQHPIYTIKCTIFLQESGVCNTLLDGSSLASMLKFVAGTLRHIGGNMKLKLALAIRAAMSLRP